MDVYCFLYFNLYFRTAMNTKSTVMNYFEKRDYPSIKNGIIQMIRSLEQVASEINMQVAKYTTHLCILIIESSAIRLGIQCDKVFPLKYNNNSSC